MVESKTVVKANEREQRRERGGGGGGGGSGERGEYLRILD